MISWKGLWFPPLNLFNWPNQNITYKYNHKEPSTVSPKIDTQKVIRQLLKDR